jgi:hypothetical protein
MFDLSGSASVSGSLARSMPNVICPEASFETSTAVMSAAVPPSPAGSLKDELPAASGTVTASSATAVVSRRRRILANFRTS